MRFQGHAAAGYIVSQAFIAAASVPSENSLWITTVGTIAGILPDLDGVYYLARKRELRFDADFTHHTWVTHTFPPYILIGLLVLLFGIQARNELLQESAQIVMISTSIHLLLDMIGSGDGIMLVWPISRRMYGIGKLHVHGMEWKRRYESSRYVWMERAIIAGAVVLLATDLIGWR
jgi:membrane-bound metal-dependent hydrolase YbcI (DUF457 family)